MPRRHQKRQWAEPEMSERRPGRSTDYFVRCSVRERILADVTTWQAGDKVIVETFQAGVVHQQYQARKLLSKRHIYTIEQIEVGGCSSWLSLEEIPGVKFNTVFFRIISSK